MESTETSFMSMLSFDRESVLALCKLVLEDNPSADLRQLATRLLTVAKASPALSVIAVSEEQYNSLLTER